MKTHKPLADAIAALDADRDAKVAALRQEYAVREMLPAACEPFAVYVHNHRATAAALGYPMAVHIKKEVTPYDAPAPHAAEVAALLEAFPPLPCLRTRGTFTRHRPAAVVESLPADHRERDDSKEALPFPGVMLRVETLHGNEISAEWFADLPGVGVAEFRVTVGNPWLLGHANAERVNHPGGYTYRNPSEHWAGWLKDLGILSTRWGRGGDQYAWNYTLALQCAPAAFAAAYLAAEERERAARAAKA